MHNAFGQVSIFSLRNRRSEDFLYRYWCNDMPFKTLVAMDSAILKLNYASALNFTEELILYMITIIDRHRLLILK